MKKIFLLLATTFFLYVGFSTLPIAHADSDSTFLDKIKNSSNAKWSKFKDARDSYFAEPFKAEGIQFYSDANHIQKIDKVYFSISSKLRIHPVIKLTDEDGNEISQIYWNIAKNRHSQFTFVSLVGRTRSKTQFLNEPLLPNDQYYVLARNETSSSNNVVIWPIPVSKTEFKRLKSLGKGAVGQQVQPLIGYNF